MLTGELYGAEVIGREGVRLGRVMEIYVEGGQVQAIGIGARTLLERLGGGRKGHRIRWDQVQKLQGGKLFVDHGPF
jgi:sporulation protein YlmC with PRC-barrel domain